jgi:predicted amidohydrolase YtcJ
MLIAIFYGFGLSLQEVDLRGTKSMEDVVKRIQAFQLEKIKLYCVDGTKMIENKRVSFKAILDKYFPNIPVVLNRVDGHAIIVNSALALAEN